MAGEDVGTLFVPSARKLQGRKRWIALVLALAAATMALFPHMPSGWTIPVLAVYGFFFMASYPMTEAALMVDAQSLTGALALYEKVGFERRRTSLVYQRSG